MDPLKAQLSLLVLDGNLGASGALVLLPDVITDLFVLGLLCSRLYYISCCTSM